MRTLKDPFLLAYLYAGWNSYEIIVWYLTTWQVNWDAMERAQAIMISLKGEARIMFLIMYGADLRIHLITAQENDMLEGMTLPSVLWQGV